MSTQGDIQLIENIMDGLNRNPVARFSYTQDAFDQDDVDGVEQFNHTAGQNIPKATKADYNPSIIDRGVRTQGASIPRMGWNHYVGRLSYNLNKLVQKLFAFFGVYRANLAHNANEYDSSARYRNGDICFNTEEINGVKIYTWYQRVSISPEVISNIPPTVALHWAQMQNKTSFSSLLPFSAPGYKHKYSIIDLTPNQYLSNMYYPVTTELHDFNALTEFDALTEGEKEAALQVQFEIYCNGQIARTGNVCRAELSVLSKFTGFENSSTDILLNRSFIDTVTEANLNPLLGPIGFSKLIKGRQAVIWLRGGTKYALWNSYGSPFSLHFSQYNNGIDSVIAPSASNTFVLTYGAVKAKVKTTEATEADDTVPLSQINGAIPLPKELSIGDNLRAIRTPGQYLALNSNIANSILELPVHNQGTFELLVSGDKAGMSITTQRICFRQSGDEYTRLLLGQIIIVDWYLSASPRGTAVGVSGLYRFTIENGNLLMHYQTGDDVPNFWINDYGELVADIV